jgi:wyosine [tRNA(Phe)-imidazoG37] synthetase (radical SAM superfamily)
MTEIARSEPLAPAAVTIFGPVPSRRLGQSLGIGNVPSKTCSYSCVYCQVGLTPATEIESRAFWSPDSVVESRRARHVRAACRRGA